MYLLITNCNAIGFERTHLNKKQNEIDDSGNCQWIGLYRGLAENPVTD